MTVYDPFNRKPKIVNIEDVVPEAKGLTALIKPMGDGDFQRWLDLQAKVEKEKDGAKRSLMQHTALISTGAAEWNFKKAGRAVPITKKSISDLDLGIRTFLAEEVLKMNPCVWPYFNQRLLESLGIGKAAKNA